MKTIRALAVGVTGSGKSYLLRRSFCRKHPRVLHLDFAREARKEARPDDIVVQGAAATLEALRSAADFDTWDIWAYFPNPRDAVPVLRALTYSRDLRSATLSEILGGVMVECSELVEIAGRGADPAVMGLWRAGRHSGISIAGATQYPRDVRATVRSQSEHVYVFAMTDELSFEWARQNFGKPAARLVRNLPPYHCLHARMRSPWVELLDEHQKPYRRIDIRAELEKGALLTPVGKT